MRKIILSFFIASLFSSGGFAAPVISDQFCEVTGHSSFRCYWITDTNSTTRIKYGESPGSYGTCPNSTGCWNRPSQSVRNHSFQITGLLSNTTYYISVCSSDGSETCSSEMSLKTDVLPANYMRGPLPPTSVDFKGSRPQITGSTLTVGADCLDETTGLQALINSSSYGDAIVIPTTTLNCSGGFTLPNKGAGSGWVTIKSGAGETRRPPYGVRDHPTNFDHAKINLTVMNHTYQSSGGYWALSSTGTQASLSGNPMITAGMYIWEDFAETPSVRRLALSSSSFSISNATNATPVVVTTVGNHGIANGKAVCISGVLGNTKANGCYTAQNVTSNTLALYHPTSGSPWAGSNSYSGGGSGRGLEWVQVQFSTFPSRPTGSCTYGEWGADMSKQFPNRAGMYRCDASGIWLKVAFWSASDAPYAFPEGGTRNTTFLAAPGAHHYYISGLKFVAPDFPFDEEFTYGFRRWPGISVTPGAQVGSILEYGSGSHHIWVDQISMDLDPTKWAQTYTIGGVGGVPKASTSAVTNSYLAGANGWTVAHHVEIENEANMFDFTGGAGPYWIENNYLEAYGWAFFMQESGGVLNRAGNVEFVRNTVYKNTKYLDGSDKYASSGLNGKWSSRQLFECKDCERVLISGNKFINNWTDASPVAAAITVGSQPSLDRITWSGNQASAPLSNIRNIAVGDKILDHTNHAIYTVNSTTGLPSYFSVSGSPAPGSAQVCKATGNNNGIRDIDVRDNSFFGVPIVMASFMDGYGGYNDTCYAVPSQRIRVNNNIAEMDYRLISKSTNFTPSTVTMWIMESGQEVEMSNNTQYVLNDHPSFGMNHLAITADPNEKVAWNTDGFISQNNIFGYGTTSGIFRSSTHTVTGAQALNLQFPRGSTVTYNSYIRASGDPGNYPPGNYWETDWGKIVFNDVSSRDFSLSAASPYISGGKKSSNGYSLGVDSVALEIAQGLVKNDRAISVTSFGASVAFTAPTSDACPVDIDTDPLFRNPTRFSGSGGSRQQSVQLSGLAPKTAYHYRVLCNVEQPSGAFVTGE